MEERVFFSIHKTDSQIQGGHHVDVRKRRLPLAGEEETVQVLQFGTGVGTDVRGDTVRREVVRDGLDLHGRLRRNRTGHGRAGNGRTFWTGRFDLDGPLAQAVVVVEESLWRTRVGRRGCKRVVRRLSTGFGE